MKDGQILTRNGNYFIVKKTKDGHYYTALLLGHARVTAWHRMPLKKIKEWFKPVENYDGDKKKFEWIKEM